MGKCDECLSFLGVKLLGEFCTGSNIKGFDDNVGVAFLFADVRATAKAPTRTRGHVHAETETVCLTNRVVKHLHPTRREIADVVGFPTARSVDGDDVNATVACVVIAREFASEIGLVHCTAHPPPVGPGALLAGDDGPAKLTLLSLTATTKKDNQPSGHTDNFIQANNA